MASSCGEKTRHKLGPMMQILPPVRSRAPLSISGGQTRPYIILI